MCVLVLVGDRCGNKGSSKNKKFRSYERETYEPDKLETTTTATKTMAPQKLEVRAEKKN